MKKYTVTSRERYFSSISCFENRGGVLVEYKCSKCGGPVRVYHLSIFVDPCENCIKHGERVKIINCIYCGFQWIDQGKAITCPMCEAIKRDETNSPFVIVSQRIPWTEQLVWKLKSWVKRRADG